MTGTVILAALTASLVWHLTDEMRERIKRIHMGLYYGMSPVTVRRRWPILGRFVLWARDLANG